MLFNAINFFGLELPWSEDSVYLALLIAQAVLILVVIAIGIGVIVRNRRLKMQAAEQPAPVYIPVAAPAAAPSAERSLIWLRLDTADVKKEFLIGEAFSYQGLIVKAMYDKPPFEEDIEDFVISIPDMTIEGRTMIQVTYKDISAMYPVDIVKEHTGEEQPSAEHVRRIVVVAADAAVPDADSIARAVRASEQREEIIVVKGPAAESATEEAPAEPEPVPEPSPTPATTEKDTNTFIIEEESFEGGTLRYDKSFTARMIQCENEIKNWYNEIKNELLSYGKIHDRMSWKRECYNFGRMPVAKIAFRGATLCLYLPLDVSAVDPKYKVESLDDNNSFKDTPCLYRLKNNKRVKYAKELIAQVMEKVGAERKERDSVDYFMPYQGLVELINQGLVRRVIKDKSQEAIFETGKEPKNPAEEAAVTEEPENDGAISTSEEN